jgi:hypothetical protein
MTTLHALRHVSSAVAHAEALADEADDLEVFDLAIRLRARAATVVQDLDEAVASIEAIEPLRVVRERSHDMLDVAYAACTLRIDQSLRPEDAARLSPGTHLDVVERVRFRLRHMPKSSEALLDARTLLERELFGYEDAVDAFLMGCAAAMAHKDRAVVRSQALRLELERAKHALLGRAEPQSDAWRRIKKRAVRTKRARWLDEARAAHLLSAATAA